MRNIPIVYKNTNLEILTKLLNSVAKKYGCAVKYRADENRIEFTGDARCCRHVTEEMLAFFPKTARDGSLLLKCPTDMHQTDKHQTV